MFETQSQLEKSESAMRAAVRPSGTRQHRLMAAALGLLIIALAIVIYRGLFPGTDEDADYDQPDATTVASASGPVTVVKPAPAVVVKNHPASKAAAPAASNPAPTAPPPATTERTVLPPLEVEVVAGDNHQTVRPGSNSVRLDLQPGVPPKQTSEPTTAADTAAASTHDAAEKVNVSAEQLVVHTVRPEYPLLARQAKVQGSVILQALIGKDGVIQNLRVLNGPPILASAAEDAVRQWRFKPHVVGQDTVETSAKITVNFTISTN